ncbi:MAG: antibiotic biosynthesis monooxygenase family protein [Gammaproteobacteria bacterium]
MVVTIFRSRLRPEHEQAYLEMATRMRALAAGMPGFLSFKTFQAEDGERVSVIEFESEQALGAWREYPDHREAQALGREAFYAEFQIQVCSIIRQYGLKSPDVRRARR